ncbi:hypothetical protein [Lentimicrobium saccharophilum]|uniref:hypothetical protein n=1 Tax=Lentimicrobium saccharophilum TaxID=1678841 RepID=UPI0010C7AA0C|nr:hypothetical protein [Lentimicrobium saccharophilum]
MSALTGLFGTGLPKMALRKQAARNREETPAMMVGVAQVIFVHRFQEEEECNNLRFFLPKSSPVFSHFWEALTFCYFLVKQKVEKANMGKAFKLYD